MSEDLNKVGAEQGQPVEAKKKSRLGVSKDVQSKAGLPIPAPVQLEKRTELFPNKWEFPVCNLVKVEFNPSKDITRNGEVIPTPVIQFVFKAKGDKQFTHVEFPIDDEDAKFDSKLQSLQQRLKHIFEETVGASKFNEDEMQGDTFAELFENVAKSFNSHTMTKGEGESAKTIPLFYNLPVYLKLVYYKDRLQMPMFPNFIQRAHNGVNNVPCEFIINPTHDKVEAQAKATNPNAGAYGGGTNGSYGGGATGGAADYDFPSIP